MLRRNFLRAILSLSPAMLAAAPVSAGTADATFPTRPVRIVVPVAPGGSADKLARTLATRLSETWHQPVVVDNVVGASGTIGAAQVAKARPDGHVLLLGGEGVTLNASLFKNLPYDTSYAFRGVTKAVVNPQVLVVRPDLGVRTFQDYVALARRKPGELALGLPGNGGIAHIAHEMLSRQLGLKVNYIPYAGGAPATVDLLGGHIDATLITLAAVTDYVRAGKLTALAVTTPYRSKALPQVPTLAEAGATGFAVESWQGLLAPAATPAAVVERINRDVAAVLHASATRSLLEDAGYVVVASSAQELDATLARDLPRYASVIAASGITLR
ncbi:Bug family tripartite tricarboxylate transporter substrate binding protein [Cupriavidus lacunae]|uniref:Tripartite tricarboxylate transporter substrate binding protein n=1 Tax=Cupriavidus lacunae TaxID=2666307 RepID=A0A370NI43_9BURK|nr:tripartite tricarboxylate transporter substrate-binding protein [Cupriavidus lacunae]RDK05271.1 tripartite tricarboxylate transporter substrate binding protein [Cupriavidus lacunae]